MADGPLPARRAPVGPRQADMGVALVDEDQVGRVQVGRRRPPGRPGLLIPLAGDQAPFF